jgi:hypothetical protein
MAEKAETEKRRRREAFVALQSLVKAVSLPTAAAASGTDIGDTSRTAGPVVGKIDLGPFALADLVEPKFRLAVPRDTVDGGEFKAQIVNVDGEGDPRWEIRYLPSAVALDGGKQPPKPRPLAFLVASEGHLFLEVPRSNELGLSPFAMLRRSVILAESKDPATPEDAAVVREIRLVEPVTVRPLVIDLFAANRQELKLIPPAGIPRTVRGADGHSALALPINSLSVEATIPKGKKVHLELLEEATDPTKHGIGSWTEPLVQLKPDLAIQAVIKLSLPQATLSVHTEFIGHNAKLYAKEKVRSFFIDKPDEVLKNLQRGFKTRVKQGLSFTSGDAQTKQGDERMVAWFQAALASQQRGGMGMQMPDHETVQKSFEAFLTPEPWDDFLKRCKQARDEKDWKSVFTDRIEQWSNWFWPQFQKQWQDNVTLFRGAVAEPHEIRIKGITSLAYDETGKVYEVPLVIGDSPLQPDMGQANGVPAADRKLGSNRKDDPVDDGNAAPPAAAGSGNSVGLD